MKKLYKSMVTLLLSGSALLAGAQVPPPFAAYDLNGNGVITADEFNTFRDQRRAVRAAEGRPMRFASAAPSFSDFDSNGDGQLSHDELVAGQQKSCGNRGSWMMQGRGMGGGTGMGGNMPSFSEFDLDQDGLLVEEEFIEARGRRISERARQGYPMRGLSNMLQFSEIDSDGNGNVTPDEFSAALALHRQQRFR